MSRPQIINLCLEDVVDSHREIEHYICDLECHVAELTKAWKYSHELMISSERRGIKKATDDFYERITALEDLAQMIIEGESAAEDLRTFMYPMWLHKAKSLLLKGE